MATPPDDRRPSDAARSLGPEEPPAPRAPLLPSDYELPQRRLLLPFTWKGQRFNAEPQRPFRPRGLVIWGAPPGATVHCWIGIHLEIVAAWGDVPARFFASGDNFEQIAKQLEAGKEPPAWVDWHDIRPGVIVQLEVRSRTNVAKRTGDLPLGPDDGIELVMWGYAR